MKKCGVCLVEKEFSEFSMCNAYKDGLDFLCKKCNSERNKKYYRHSSKKYKERSNSYRFELRNERRLWMQEYKKKNPCVSCGESDTICLDFHHLRDKKYTVGVLWASSCSVELLESEVAKCTIICANCHRKLHGEMLELLPNTPTCRSIREVLSLDVPLRKVRGPNKKQSSK